MKYLEINKYSRKEYKGPNFNDSWTSCSDIATGKVTRAEYLDVEARYLRAILRFISTTGSVPVLAHNVEFWHETNKVLAGVELEDVLVERIPPLDGEPLVDLRLDAAIKRCLREAAWLELVRPRQFLIHFGYDLRVLVAADAPVDEAIKATTAEGLFVYPGNPNLETLKQWRSSH